MSIKKVCPLFTSFPSRLATLNIAGCFPNITGMLSFPSVISLLKMCVRHAVSWKKTEPSIVIDDLVFSELNKHTSPEEVTGYLAPLAKGESVGVISEAGCPAVADPGADVVAIAQRKGYKVVPLVGPSSILMSVMGSGFNGQSFAFHGYLPIDASQRTNAIKKLEGRIYSENQTQLFIETPYRNNKLAEELIRTCRPSTKLCIASNITCEDEYIHTRPVKEWAGKVPDLSKKPTIFLIYK